MKYTEPEMTIIEFEYDDICTGALNGSQASDGVNEKDVTDVPNIW